MDDRDRARAQIARRVAALTHSEPSFRKLANFTHTDGTRPILVALADDTIGEVFGRVQASYPSGANLVIGVPDAPGQRGLFVLTLEPEADSASFGQQEGDHRMDPAQPVGMLVAYTGLFSGSVRVGLQEYAVAATAVPV